MKPVLRPFILLLMFSACGGEKTKTAGNHGADLADSLAAPIKPVDRKGYDPGEHLNHDGLQSYFNSPRVDEWVKNKPPFADEDEMDYVHDFLGSGEMAGLNVKELIYYCTKFPASFSQICSDSWDPDQTDNPKITAHFYFDYSGETRSTLQERALADRSDSVVIRLREYLENTPGALDEDALVLLYELDPVESIPVVIKTLSAQHLANYTYLMLVMKDHQYSPFLQTVIYKTLYGTNAWHYSKIAATTLNRKLIAGLANDFYESKKSP